MKKYSVKTSDPITNDVIDRIFKRHIQGMQKFKQTMDENPKTIDDWTEDIIEELIDAICYLVVRKKRLKEIKRKDYKEAEDLKKELDMLRDDLQIVNLENGRMMEKINRLKNHGKNKT